MHCISTLCFSVTSDKSWDPKLCVFSVSLKLFEIILSGECHVYACWNRAVVNTGGHPCMFVHIINEDDTLLTTVENVKYVYGKGEHRTTISARKYAEWLRGYYQIYLSIGKYIYIYIYTYKLRQLKKIVHVSVRWNNNVLIVPNIFLWGFFSCIHKWGLCKTWKIISLYLKVFITLSDISDITIKLDLTEAVNQCKSTLSATHFKSLNV